MLFDLFLLDLWIKWLSLHLLQWFLFDTTHPRIVLSLVLLIPLEHLVSDVVISLALLVQDLVNVALEVVLPVDYLSELLQVRLLHDCLSEALLVDLPLYLLPDERLDGRVARALVAAASTALSGDPSDGEVATDCVHHALDQVNLLPEFAC